MGVPLEGLSIPGKSPAEFVAGGPSVAKPKSPVGPAPAEQRPASEPSPEEQALRLNLQRERGATIVQGGIDQGVFTVQDRISARIAAESGGQNTRALLASLRVSKEIAKDDPASLANITSAYNDLSKVFEITIDGKTTSLSQLEKELAKGRPTKARRAQITAAIEESLSTQTILREVAGEVASGSGQPLTGEGLKGILQATRTYIDQIPDQASDAAKAARSAYEKVSEATFVTYGGKLYSLADLERERTLVKPEKAEEIDRIIQGGTYEAPLDELGTGRRLIDQERAEQIRVLEAKKNRSGNEEAILQKLKGLTGGNARDAIAVTAFKQLREMGVGGLDSVIARGEAAELDSLDRIKRALESNKYTTEQMRTIVPAILNGSLQALMNWEVLGKPGVDLLFFDQNKTDVELAAAVESMFPQEAKSILARHGRNAGIVMLLMLMMGSGPLARMFEEKNPRAA